MSNQFLKLRRSSVPGKIPTTSSLEFGEIALNTYDGLAFIKKSGSNGEEIVTIGGTASGSATASYALFALTSSYSTNINGEQYYAAVYTDPNTLSTGSIYDSGSFTAIGDTAPLDPTNPDRLFVNAGNTTSYNLISAHGEIDNYLQLNVQNFSYGATASSDLVATANNGTQNENYIDVGINNSGYNIQDGIGAANDAYIYSTGNDLLIGNLSDGKKIIIFNGSGTALSNARIIVFDQGTVGINAIDPDNANPEALLVEPLPGSTNDFNNLIIGRGEIQENYLQFNIQNTGSGSIASSDIVATNDIGDETSYFIDMGINSSGYNTPSQVGGPNDAYIYSTGEHLHIGNATNNPVMFFAGGLDADVHQKLYLDPSGSHQMTGSLSITDGFSGSLYGTASWALNTLTASYVANAISASYALTASYALNISGTIENATSASYADTASWAINALTASSADNFTVRGGLTGSDALFTGTITAQRLNVQYITSSTEFITGSTKFGTQLTDTHQFTGSVSITGSLTVAGTLNATSSYALNALSSSYSLTASYVQLAQTASFVTQAQTASYVLNAVSSSFSSTASFVNLAQTASFVATASWAQNAITASYVLNAVSSSFASTASFVVLSQTASFVATASWAQNAITASYVLNAVSSSFASTASYVLNAVSSSFASTASFVTTAQTASFVTASNVFGPFGSNSVISSSYALTASFALNAAAASTFQIATGSVTASVNVASVSFQVTSASVVLMALDRAGALTASRAFLSSSNGTSSGSTLIVYGSGSAQPVFTVQGSQGELFSVSDSLSGSLFSVNDISGLPVIEAFSDNRVLIGSYQAPVLVTTVRTTTAAGNNVIFQNLPTASYDGAFFDYTVRSGSNARAGQIMAIWSASSVNFTETTTTDFGDTSTVRFMVMVTGSNMALTGSFPTANWTMKTIIRSI